MREHPPGDVASLEPVLEEDPRRVVGPLAGPADDVDLAIARQLVEAGPQLGERDVDDARHLFDGKLGRLADVEEGRVLVA